MHATIDITEIAKVGTARYDWTNGCNKNSGIARYNWNNGNSECWNIVIIIILNIIIEIKDTSLFFHVTI